MAGLVLWIPVLGRIPGILRLKPVVRFGYLVVQAVVPAFLSFIYIFSRRPLYAEFSRSHAAIGLRPLNDQQIAGFVSKLSMLFVLLIVGAVVLARAPGPRTSSARTTRWCGPTSSGSSSGPTGRADGRVRRHPDARRRGPPTGTISPAAPAGGSPESPDGDRARPPTAPVTGPRRSRRRQRPAIDRDGPATGDP